MSARRTSTPSTSSCRRRREVDDSLITRSRLPAHVGARPFIDVVPPATELDIADGGRALVGVRPAVVELDKRPLVAAPPVGGHVRATPLISPVDRPLDLRGDVA